MLKDLPIGVTKAICPISNLLIFQEDSWKEVKLSNNCTCSYLLIGGHILLSRPVGLADGEATKNTAEFINKIIVEHLKDKDIVIVQDYTNLISFTEEAREHYINHKMQLKNIRGIIFYGVSPLLKLGIKLGQRQLGNTKLYIVNDYREAINLAVPILSSKSVKLKAKYSNELGDIFQIGNNIEQREKSYSVNYIEKVLELIANIKWDEPGLDLELRKNIDKELKPILDALYLIKYDLDKLIEELKNINSQLQRQKDLYKKVFDNVSHLLYIHDLEGNILLINSAWEKLGYSEKDLGQLTIWDIVPPKYHNEVTENLKRMKSENEQTGLIRIVSKYGNEHLFEYRSAISYDDEKQQRLVYGFAREIEKNDV